MSNDVDFEQFIKILDAALASDDDNVKNALRKFLFVAALALGDDCKPGPFTKMMETIDGLQKRIATLESQNNSYTYGGQDCFGSPTFPNWYYGGGMSTSGTPPSVIGGSSTSGTVTASSGTSTNVKFNYNPSSFGSSNTTFNWMIPEDDSGTSIKEDIKEKLQKLVKNSE